MVLPYLQCKETLLTSVIDVVKSNYPLWGKIIVEFNSQIERIPICLAHPICLARPSFYAIRQRHFCNQYHIMR